MTEKETPSDYLQNRTFSMRGTQYKDLVHLKDALEAVKMAESRGYDKGFNFARLRGEKLIQEAEARGYEKGKKETAKAICEMVLEKAGKIWIVTTNPRSEYDQLKRILEIVKSRWCKECQ